MRRRFGKPSVPGLIFFGVLVVAVIIGVIIGGGTGTTVAAIGGAILALSTIGTLGGTGIAAQDAVDGRGRWFGAHPLDEEDRGDDR